MQLDFTPFANALARLQEGWERYQLDIGDTQIRDGLIQRFEFTYEIATKFLRRYLRSVAANPEAFASLDFQSVVRTGNASGVLRSDWQRWRQFREMRGKTSHAYDESVAKGVVAEIPDFVAEAHYLLEHLSGRLLAQSAADAPVPDTAEGTC
jgi:nucleotidyltransferase substrate binding protein (TIGR01987 family)